MKSYTLEFNDDQLKLIYDILNKESTNLFDSHSTKNETKSQEIDDILDVIDQKTKEY